MSDKNEREELVLYNLNHFQLSFILGYQKDNNFAAHSVDIYIFNEVIHLHLHAS